MQKTIHVSTNTRNGLYEITRQVEAIISESGVQTGLVNVNAQVCNSRKNDSWHLNVPGEKWNDA